MYEHDIWSVITGIYLIQKESGRYHRGYNILKKKYNKNSEFLTKKSTDTGEPNLALSACANACFAQQMLAYEGIKKLWRARNPSYDYRAPTVT